MEQSVRFELDQRMEALGSKMLHLRDLLLTDGLIKEFKVYSITSDGRNKLVHEIEDLTKAVETLFIIHSPNPLNTKESLNFPGYFLICPTLFSELGIESVIHEINRSKALLHDHVNENNKPKQVETNHGLKVKVNPFLFECYPMVNACQLYRDIPLIIDEVSTCSFTWSIKRRYQKFDIEKAKKIANGALLSPAPFEMTTAHWKKVITEAISTIDNLVTDTTITRITLNPSSPYMCLTTLSKTKYPKFYGGIPTLIVNQSDLPFKCTQPLTDHVNHDVAHPTAFGWTEVCDLLNMYTR